MIKAKKSLGQNFLKDDTIVDRIIECANLSNDDVVVEIGPGMGVLTEKLAKVCKKVIAIELDDRLIDLLRNKLRNFENVEVIHDDILKINLPKLLTTNNLQHTKYKVVANLPYYITSPILRLLLETQYPPSEIVVMVQKEVAERICAAAGEMSILAVAVQYYADAEYLFTVPRTAFDPSPKVESAIIKISSIASSPSGRGCPEDRRGCVVDKENTKKFFRIVRAGFSAKRKTLANNLSNSLQLEKKNVEEKIESLGFSKNARAQELGVEDWKKLVAILTEG